MTSMEELLRRSIVLVDKPSGPNCRTVDDRVKSILKRKKTGHSGTLDSKVTGLLLVALDEAVKIMPFLVGSDKTYEGIIYLHEDVEMDDLGKFIKENFVGEIIQVPPLRSRVARKPRKRIVYSFNLIKKKGKDIYFETEVEAGTYIRKLVHDIGEKFGVGMHMKSLRRINVGKFSVDNAVRLEKLWEAYKAYESGNNSPLERALLPVEKVLEGEKRVLVKKEFVEKAKNGSPVYWEYIEKIDNGIKKGSRVVLIYDEKIFGIGVAKMGSKDMPGIKSSVVKTDRILL
jgi:H/ACA ribonucleoprotein complex subunit 4